jgi:hypothetical protein
MDIRLTLSRRHASRSIGAAIFRLALLALLDVSEFARRFRGAVAGLGAVIAVAGALYRGSSGDQAMPEPKGR